MRTNDTLLDLDLELAGRRDVSTRRSSPQSRSSPATAAAPSTRTVTTFTATSPRPRRQAGESTVESSDGSLRNRRRKHAALRPLEGETVVQFGGVLVGVGVVTAVVRSGTYDGRRRADGALLVVPGHGVGGAL